MRLGHKVGDTKRRRGKARGAGPRALIAHRVFAPLLGLWGAALGGLAVLVLPAAALVPILRRLSVAVPASALQAPLAVFAAAVLGGALFVGASALTKRVRSAAEVPPVAATPRRRVRPIDPVRDLGSNSLDDPLDTGLFANAAWREELEAAHEPPLPEDDDGAPDETDMASPPREFDLSEFGAMPGRNAVWVEDGPASPSCLEPIEDLGEGVMRWRPPASPPPEPGTAALARLRAVPPDQLSLAEMVERFAGALHEHRTTPAARSQAAADPAAREAALAEALKALAALSGGTKAQAEERPEAPLRAALARLQDRRGAA